MFYKHHSSWNYDFLLFWRAEWEALFHLCGEAGVIMKFEPCREKTGPQGFWPPWTQTVLYSHSRWLQTFRFRKYIEELYYLCSENIGTDQLCGYRKADLRLCFCICKKQIFLWHGWNCFHRLCQRAEWKVLNLCMHEMLGLTCTWQRNIGLWFEMNSVSRKLVFGVSDQARLKTAKDTGWSLEFRIWKQEW